MAAKEEDECMQGKYRNASQNCGIKAIEIILRPRPKKEKARMNYRIAQQQKRRRAERQQRRRQQQEILRAQQRLLQVSVVRGEEKKEAQDSSEEVQRTPSLFSVDGPLFAPDQAAAAAAAAAKASSSSSVRKSLLQGSFYSPLPARINYRLVGGTWRKAKGQTSQIRMTGAQLAAAVFEGLPEEDVATAIARAKRQDEGFMDLEEYDDSDTKHTCLEGIN
ncbi:hypothetical protein, conserved [Eimeria brunetti]|uniref:Uncharacterized protein n=1 Tax=Eimeria brunetti TaxID=51314 RepID=U6LJA0_9EIME|nr:hypothetical protein, conserved [Eimeria brunetti]